MGHLRREPKDWWEQCSGKCSCKNRKLFLPEDLEENIGVSFRSKSFLGCMNGKEKDKGAFTLPSSISEGSLFKLVIHMVLLWIIFSLFSSLHFHSGILRLGGRISLWLPPFLVVCSSWNKALETVNVLNTWKKGFPCHLCTSGFQEELFLCYHYL